MKKYFNQMMLLLVILLALCLPGSILFWENTWAEENTRAAVETASSENSESTAETVTSKSQTSTIEAVSPEKSQTGGENEKEQQANTANQKPELSREERLALIEAEEAAKREEKEHELKSVVFRQMLGDFGDAFEAAEVYFFCIDGQDYIAASDGNRRFVYLPRMTKSGEYFLADEEADQGAVSKIDEALDEAHLKSTQDFWNKIALAEKPEEVPEIPHPVDENGVMMVPYYNQGGGYYENGEWTHTDWPSATFYNGRTLQQVGCGFAAVAMALSYCRQETISPLELMDGPDYNGNGADGTIGVNAAEAYDVPAYMTGDFGDVLEKLKTGHPVMVFVGKSAFTTGTHYILLVGVLPDGTIAVNDPSKTYNTYFYCGVTFTPSYVQSAALGGEPYTVFG